MSPRLVIALLKFGGLPLLCIGGLSYGYLRLDAVTRAERAESEKVFREERREDRKTWLKALDKISDACLAHVGHGPRVARAAED